MAALYGERQSKHHSTRCPAVARIVDHMAWRHAVIFWGWKVWSPILGEQMSVGVGSGTVG